MKKIICFVITSVFLLIIDVSAMEKPAVPAESDLIGMCYYEYNVGDKQYNLELYIKKDYSMIALGNNLKYQDLGYASSGVVVTVSYDSFMSNNVFSCNNVSNVYVNRVLSGPDWTTETFYVDLNENDHETNDMSGANYPHKYYLNIEKSKVYELNQDSDLTNSGEWVQICHYGSSYLKIGKSSFETNVDYYNQNEILKEKLMTLLSDNYYTCPVSLCNEYTYDVYYSYFEYQYKPKCIISTQYSSEWNCGLLSTYMKKYDSLKTDSLNSVELNKTIDTIKNFCSSVFEYQNYDSPTKCVKECLEINEIFEKDINLGDIGECDFSQRLLAWASNILRWIKYILPVIVIVLGILDFIKAIGADKDDEMKKAQKRFITRLIAAALVFIIPLIIEFVLNKMGFGYDSCGLF